MTSILLIDDDDVLREVIASALERQGYQVRQAENGEKGIALFNEKRPDIVITDLIMPEKEGDKIFASHWDMRNIIYSTLDAVDAA